METTEEIKQRLDVVDLVGGYVRLTQAGSNWKGLCPFHTEKSPSFMVSREKGIWHCFGCDKGGDIFSFIQEMEGMDFSEALRFLATKAGVEIKRDDPRERSERQHLLELNELAARVYHKILLAHEKAADARAYLEKRGVTTESIERFRLGYAPESWEGVGAFLRTKGASEDAIFKAGLSVRRERGTGYYDRFRNRIMFPIRDHLGRTVGFGGRALAKDQEPKYLNTPQTLIYNKSEVLFGIDMAKRAIKEQQVAVLVEGYMDVLSSHQAGVQNVVASSGTALTAGQVRHLKRYTQTIALAFDADVAGTAASLRGVDVAWAEGMDVRIVVVEGAKDPDELIQKNPEAWKKAIASARPIMEHAFTLAQQQYPIRTVEGKKRAAKFLLPLIGRLGDAIEQTHYLQSLAGLLHVREEDLRGLLPRQRGSVRPQPVAPPPQRKKGRDQRIAEQLIAIASQHREHLEYLIDHLEPDYLVGTDLLGLYKSLITYYTEHRAFDQEEFLNELTVRDAALAQQAKVLFLLGTSDLLPQEETRRRQEVLDGVSVLRRLHLQRELERLQQQLVLQEQQGDAATLQSLTEKVNELSQQLVDTE